MYQLVHTSCMEAVKSVKMSCPSKNFGPHYRLALANISCFVVVSTAVLSALSLYLSIPLSLVSCLKPLMPADSLPVA